MIVRPDGLTIVEKMQFNEVSFEDIQEVYFHHFLVLFGYFKIVMKNGSIHIFPMGLERSEYVIDAIAARHEGLMQKKQYIGYRIIAILIDHAWARINDRMRNWKVMGIRLLVLPVLFLNIFLVCLSLKTQKIDISLFFIEINFIIFFLGNLWAALMASLITEVQLSRLSQKRIILDPMAVRRNLIEEAKFERYGNVIYLLASIAICSFYVVVIVG